MYVDDHWARSKNIYGLHKYQIFGTITQKQIHMCFGFAHRADDESSSAR